eukprot:PhF_6_TR1000/c1_g1_i2/m.1977
MINIFSIIYRYFSAPFLPNDDFTQTCRKYVFTISFCIWPLLIIQNLLHIKEYIDQPLDTILQMADSSFFILWLPGLYISLRNTFRVSDRLMGLWLLLASLTFGFQIFRTTLVGYAEYILIITLFAIIGQVYHLWIYVGLGLTFTVIYYYNIMAVSSTSYTPLMFDASWSERQPCPRPSIVLSILNLIMIMIVLILVRSQTKAFTDQLNTAKQNLDVTRDVAEYLANYNTSEARTSLSKHNGEGDPKLMAYLTMIVDNMDKYRPYLPNYLLMPTSSSTTEEDIELCSSMLSVVQEKQGGGTMSSRDSDTGSAMSPKSPTAATNSASGTPLIRTGSFKEATPRSRALFVRKNSGLSVPTAVERNVTMCGITFNGVFDSTLLEAAQVQRVTDFVDRIHNIAFDHCGAVHSFLGDVCMMSWNVATRCVNHEVRAVTSVMCLKDNSRAFGLEYVVAGIVSGRGRCQLGGTSTVACTLHAPNVTRLHGAVMCHATRIHSVVCDDTVCRAVEHSAITQSVEAVTFEQRLDEKANSVFLLHEVLRLLKHDDDEDREWMYRMQQSNGPQRKVNEALRKALAGEVATALALLEEVEAADAMTSGSKCLQSKLKTVSMLPALIVYPFMRM